MQVKMYLLCFSSLLCWSATLANLDEQISLRDAVKMIRDLQEANVEDRRGNRAMESKMEKLQEANLEIQTENDEIRTEYDEIRRENAEIQTENATIRRKNAEVQKENEAIKSKLSELVNFVSHIEMDLVDLQANISNFKQQISVLNDRDSGHVGFSVATDQIEEYNAGDTVKFHYVFSDFKPSGTSGGWDPSSNRYMCPVSGQYMFMVTVYKRLGDEYDPFVAELYHTSGSGDILLTSVQNFGGTDMRFSSSRHAIVHCATGDQVWLRNYLDDSSLYGSSAHHNNFLGFLIKPDL